MSKPESNLPAPSGRLDFFGLLGHSGRPGRRGLHGLLGSMGSLGLLGAALLPVLLAGCMNDAEENGIDLPAGMTDLASLKGARTAVALGGKLYVGNAAEDAMGIAVADIASGKIVAFHGQDLPPTDMAASGDSLVVVAGTDYKVGALSLLNIRTSEWKPGYKAVHSDIAVHSQGEKVFLMERSLGVVTGFTRGLLEEDNVFLNVNAGSRSNPYTVALHGNTAFVTRYGGTHLLILEADKKDGGARDSIDLSGWVANGLQDSAGAVPHMAAAVVHGDRLFVTVQRLKGWSAEDTSKVLIIDVGSREVTGAIDLRRKNPIAVAARGKYLYVSCVEGYGTFTGAVERIDMETAQHAGLIVEEKDLTPPSDLTAFVPAGDANGFVLHTPDFETGLVSEIDLP